MGAKAKEPTRARRSKSPSSKTSGKISARKRHHFYPDSIPPGMAAEVFDVSRIDEDGLEVLDDDEVVPDSDAPGRSRWHHRPSKAPHPPRPSIRPPSLTPAQLRLDTPLSYASNPAAVLLEPPFSGTPAPASTGRGWARTALALAGAALLALSLGMLLARHGESAGVPPANAAVANAPPAREPAPAVAAPLAPFSSDVAARAVRAAVERARACRTADPPDGTLDVKLMFAQTGQVVGVDIAPPFAGTPAGDCFAAALRETRVPPFEGSIAELGETLTLPALP